MTERAIATMTQTPQPEKQFVFDYIKAHGYGDFPPDSMVRPPIVKTGNIVQDYIAAAGYELPKKPAA